jgi:hypothetical protein
MRVFASDFFHRSVFPQPQSIPIRPFRNFSKIGGDSPKSRCTTGINDTGDTGVKTATGINDTGGKSTTPMVLPELRISPRIFEKIRNGPNGILRGLGENDSCKKPEVENLVALSL